MTTSGGLWAYVGTYGDGEREAVYGFRVDDETGGMERVQATDAGENPSFLAVHPSLDVLFAVEEVESGSATAFEIDPGTGALRRLGRARTGGNGPCHCTLDRTGHSLLVAHYHGGSVAMLPVDDDGRVGDAVDVAEHRGSGPHPERQTGPHPHSVHPGPDGQFAYVPDLGTDRVVAYDLAVDEGRLRPAPHATASLPDGSGPRHLDFHPDGDVAFVVGELDSTLTALARDPVTGSLSVIGDASTVPDGYAGENYPGEVRVHPSGRWVYASNRGHDSVAVFAADGTRGNLELVETTSTVGKWPRHFAITRGGGHLVVANQRNDAVVAFAIDEDDGTLTPTGDAVAVPSPACVQFVSRR